MNYFDLLPKFNIIEPNNLKGLQPGFVVAQAEPAGVYNADGTMKAVSAINAANKLINTNTTGHYFVENGQLAALTKDGYVDYDTYAATVLGNGLPDPAKVAEVLSTPLYVTYTEEIVAVGNDFKYYAAEINHDPARLVQLIPGDEFTTTYAPDSDQMAAAITAGRIACITRNYIDGNTTATDHAQYCFDDFLDCNKFADGQPSYTYVFLK